jgi:hypothetical protein
MGLWCGGFMTGSTGTIRMGVMHALGWEKLYNAGDPPLVVLPPASGGQSQIGAIQKYDPDLLICGELNEWETSEYVRDARFLWQLSEAKVWNEEEVPEGTEGYE